MLEPPLTPEEIERVKETARQYRTTQQALLKAKSDAQGALDDANYAVYLAGKKEGLAVDFLRAQQRVFEMGLAQLEVWDLEANLFAPTLEANTAAYEGRQLELDLAILQLDLISLEALNRLVAADPTAGARGPKGPNSWLEEKALLQPGSDRQAQWMKFQEAFEAFKQQMAGLAAAPTEGPSPERLVWLRKQVPNLKGAQYRVHGVLRLLPTGETILADTRLDLIASLGLKPRPPGVKAPAPKKKRGAVTDRLFEIFKPGK